MNGVDAAFWVLGFAAILSGWRSFCTDSMVRASFLLLLSFIAAGCIMLLLGAPYIGVATIFMMAVEMMVMALFMVMFMMNPAGLNPMSMVHQQRFAIIAASVAFTGLAGAILLADFPSHPVGGNQSAIRDLGIELLGDSMLIFESAGVTLLATMVGAVILSSRSGRFGPADKNSVPPALVPGSRPAGQAPDEKNDGHAHDMPAGAPHTMDDMPSGDAAQGHEGHHA